MLKHGEVVVIRGRSFGSLFKTSDRIEVNIHVSILKTHKNRHTHCFNLLNVVHPSAVSSFEML